MARDVAGLLDEIGIESTYLLGYSMGGAIAQEFIRQFPERVAGLILCATMCGGPRATYAKLRCARHARSGWIFARSRSHEGSGRSPTHPAISGENCALAEDQMRREIALPTPLHAADLQFQAFAEFDGSKALSQIRCPTLVLTGDLDRLIRPENSRMLRRLIPGAKLRVIPGGGHRVLWEAVEKCTDLITGFLVSIRNQPVHIAPDPSDQEDGSATPHPLVSAAELLAALPLALAGAGHKSLKIASAIHAAWFFPFGDGKPIIILAPHFIGSDLVVLPFSMWLKALGYRPVTAGESMSLDNSCR